jgi:hypothetical protein
MAIPTVQGSAVVAAPYGAATLDPNALMGPGRGMQAIAQGIGQLGDVAARFAEKKQDALNLAAVSKAQLAIEKATDDFQATMHSEPDETKWQKGYVDTIEKTKAGLKLDTLPEAVRVKVEADLNHTIQKNSSVIGIQANTRSIQRAGAQHTIAAEYYYEKGQYDKGAAELDAAAKSGAMFPEVAEAKKVDLQRKGEMSQAYALVQADPFTAPALIDGPKFSSLTEQEKYSLKNSAKGEQSKLRNLTQDDIQKRRFAGEVISDDELQSMVAKNLADPGWARAFSKQQAKDLKDGQTTEKSDAMYYELKTAARAWSQEKGGPEEADRIKRAANANLPPRLVTDVFDALDQKDDKKSGVLTTPVAKFALDNVRQNFDAGVYGKFEVPDVVAGGKVTDPVALALATKRRAEIEDDLTAFLKSKPEATRGEVMLHLETLNEKHVTEAGRAAVAPFLNVPNKSQTTQSAQARWDAIKKANAIK